jgi:protein O-GlcNAc transferase
MQAGGYRTAARKLETFCRDTPSDAHARFLLGACYHAQGRFTEALDAFKQTLALNPDHLDCAQAVLAVLCALGRAREALAECPRLLKLAPNDARLRFNVALVHEAVDDFDAAIAAYDDALARDGTFVQAIINRGYALIRAGRLEEAYENNRHAASAYPSHADIHFNLGDTCLALSRYEEAITHCDRALELVPTHVKALFDRALALAALGHIEAASGTFERARGIDAVTVRALEGRVHGSGEAVRPIDPREVYLVRGFEALDRCDWSRRDEYLARFAAWINHPESIPLDARPLAWRAIVTGIDPRLQQRLAEQVASRIAQLAHPMPAVARSSRAEARRLRLGYVAAEFRAHPVAWLSERLYGLHDRSRFEVFGYATTPTDGSAVRSRIANAVDMFRDLSAHAIADIAGQIRADEIDVLIDLTGYLSNAKPEIFAMRPALVNVSYIGYPGTTGAAYIDYAIVDRVAVPPGSEHHFSERLVFLPDTFWCYGLPTIDARSIPSRAALGLPQDGLVFAAFHNGFKIGPEIFARWMEILRRVDGSVLWALARRDAVRDNLLREATRHGISAERLVFAPPLPHEQHLVRQAAADLFLDTPACSAATTCLDALWSGLPVLACPSASFAGRQSASALAALGVRDLIGTDLDDYVERAVRIASDRTTLHALRTQIAAARHTAPLFNMERRVGELETAFTTMIERWHAALPPASFAVGRTLR